MSKLAARIVVYIVETKAAGDRPARSYTTNKTSVTVNNRTERAQ